MKRSVKLTVGFLFLTNFFLSGCMTDKMLQRINHEQAATIQSLNNEIRRLNSELDQMVYSTDELGRAKDDLEKRLKQELKAGDVSLSMQDRGLVVTVLNRILFDSGKSNLKSSAMESLDKVAKTLQNEVDTNMVFVEGHTDNEPIRHSAWRSNWELSTARATEVIHYFIEKRSFDPVRLAATGYGEFQPVEDNTTLEGRMKNRRVDIIISPRKIALAGVR